MKTFLSRLIFVLPALLLFQLNGNSQDIHFSQFSETPLLLNPALAGIFSGDVRVQGVFRNQWNSVTVPFQTTSLNAEYKLPVGHGDDFVTIGGAILYDKAGTIALTSTSVLPVFNYHKSLSSDRNMYLSAGFSAGIVQRRFDESKVTTNDQFNGMADDPTINSGENFAENNLSYFDGSAGLSFNTQVGSNPEDNMYLGIANDHFNQSAKISFFNNSEVQIEPKWVYSAGYKNTLSDLSYITFYANYSVQGVYTEAIGGMLYSMKLDNFTDDPRYTISGGGFLRWGDAFIPMLKLEMKPMSFALSYDVNVSALKASNQSRGGFELSLSYQGFVNHDKASNEPIRCPRF